MNRSIALLSLGLAATSLIAAESSEALMQRILLAADKNKDGKLSLEEYKTLDVQSLHHGDEHFKTGDKNNDGFIDASELAGALNKQTWFAILTEGIEPCFHRLDSNSDGKLDATEYRKISKMGHHSDQHFNGADTNKDSFLNLAEQKLRALEGGATNKKSKKQ